jgi:2,3,4,5-tetrahydropyridine-2-carboxylate N-succinyltransferase
VLLAFRLRDNEIMQGSFTHYFDKVDSKFARFAQGDFAAGGYRVVPPATVRQGAFIAKNVVLMPSYVNIGAYVDEGTMVDTWATVGSCAQIGKNVHLSGGVGHRRRARAAAGQPHDHRGQLLHRARAARSSRA